MIKVTIKCNTKESIEIPEDLRGENEWQWREGYIFIDNIQTFYQQMDKDNTMIDFCNGENCTVKESVNEVAKLIEHSRNQILHIN